MLSEKSVTNKSLVGWAVEIKGKLSLNGIFAKNVGRAKNKDKKNTVPKNKVFLSLLKNIAKKAMIRGKIPIYPTNSA